MSEIPGHNSYNTNLCEPRPSIRSTPSYYQFSVEERYGAPFEQLTPPAGYEFTGDFRPSKSGELSLGHVLGVEYVNSASSNLPVLILRPRPKRKRIIFEEIAKVAAGSPIAGYEWYQFGVYEDVFKATTASRSSKFAALTTIYSRREEEF